jgi:protocatechuate 3,4-dioxygenase beta subunit
VKDLATVGAVLLLCASACASQGAQHEPELGGPCEGCEAVFVGMPEFESLQATAHIAPAGEPGEELVLEGTVRTAAGKPASGIIVYAYHTDAGGIYPRAATRHGRLRGWTRTDSTGRYRFDTIRPGAYPEGSNPQHIHMHVIEPGRWTYWIGDVIFTDDPLLTDKQRENPGNRRGGYGETMPRRDEQGVWWARRDIVLGEGIPEYPRQP